MRRTGRTIGLAAAVLALGIAACGGEEDDPPGGDAHGEVPMMGRHAQEADSMATAMHRHIRHMRELSAGEWHDEMGEHVAQVSRMLGLMNRQMREMDMGMGMSDEQMGRMMGMSGEEHRRMTEDMRALRNEVEQLQTASREQVREQMPPHLDRLERMVEMMEDAAEHMRAM